MRIQYLLSLLFLVGKLAAQDTLQWQPLSQKDAQKISFLEYKYQTGYYEEVIAKGASIVKKAAKPSYISTTAYLYQSLAYVASLQLEAATSTLVSAEKNIAGISEKNTKLLALLVLANYYELIGNYTSAEQSLDRADSLIDTKTPDFIVSEMKGHQIILKTANQYYNDALALIYSQKEATYAATMATSIDSVRLFQEKENELYYRKQKYANLINLEVTCLAGKGNFRSADSLIKSQLVWLDKNLKDPESHKAALLATMSETLKFKKDYTSMASYYLQAYQLLPYTEKAFTKLYYLSNAIEYFYRSGRIIESQNYARRLQQLAYQSVGKIENLQLAYELSESERIYLSGDNKTAEKRVAALIKQYKSIPDYHQYKLKVYYLLSELYEKTGNIKGLLENEALLSEILKKYYGENSLVYHKQRLHEAMFEIKFGKNFSQAKHIMKTSYDGIVRLQLDELSVENIHYLESYADLYYKLDLLDSASYRREEVVAISKKYFGENSSQTANALALHADMLIESGKYKEGLEALAKADAANESVKASDIALVQHTCLLLSKLNKLIGEYEKSESLLKKALRLENQVLYNDFLVQAEAAEQNASLFAQTGNYSRADKSLVKAIQLKTKNLPTGSPLFIFPYSYLASLKITTGDYAEVEKYLLQAQTIGHDVYGGNSLLVNEVEVLKGDYLMAISDYKNSEMAYSEADQMVLTKLSAKHLKHAEMLLKLISVRSKMPAYKNTDIEKMYSEALSIVKNALGVSSPLYMSILQKQAGYFIEQGKYKEAEKNLIEVEKYWKAKLGDNNPYLSAVYEMRGDIFYALTNYTDSEKQYSKARDIYVSLFSDTHPNYTNVSGKMARVYYMNKDRDKAISLMNEIIPKYLDFTARYFPSMSFRQKSIYWNSIRDEFEFYNTLAFNTAKPDKEMWAKAYNNTLATKAILLSSGVKLLNQIMSSNDTILIAMYNEWISKKEYLLTILTMSKAQLEEQGVNRSAIENEIEQLEKQMSTRSVAFAVEEKKKKSITWENVKLALHEGEYAVEIIRYRKFDKKFTDSIYYASFVVNRGSSMPYMILSDNGINMEKRNLKYYRNTTTTLLDDQFSYATYWKNIKSVIPDGALVYVSGDGVYNQINLEMLRKEDKIYAIDENKFVFVSNTKDILKTAQPSKKQKETKGESSIDYLLCGDPDFYMQQSAIVDKKVPELPGTEKEIALLNELIVSAEKRSLVLLKDQLTEDTLKSIKNPRVIHIATHGFFKETKPSEEEDLANSPMLNSGLMLYASGDIVDNPNNTYVNQRSGILTAYEAMNMSLDNTELVVLSACETGRGEVQVGEGVAGLQRALLLAGSKAVIVSLFKVNDEVTQKLMLSFYQKWLKTNDKRKAFADAKREIKQQYKEPIYWGAFMMIEGVPSRTSSVATQ